MKKSESLSKNPSKKTMTLAEYLKKNGTLKKYFAEQIGVKDNQLSRWLTGRSIPCLETAIMIEDVTKGQVTCRDWLKTASESKRLPQAK
jgi:transcriptional regulator with XRE-family HTH domain